MDVQLAASKKRAGRPLSFDREEALRRAMHAFWATGYETTSVTDLTSAMGITAPSLYAAFGDKESLFMECLARYTASGDKTTAESIAEAPSAQEAARNLLNVAADWYSQPNTPPGCLVASAASSGSSSSLRVRKALVKVRQTNRKALQKRVERDVREGVLPKGTNARALAALTMAVLQGMSTLARDGAHRFMLREVAQVSMAAWPPERS